MTKLAMDDAARWLEDLNKKVDAANKLLDVGFGTGNWSHVVEAKKILNKAIDSLRNLETLALPDNWRMLAERDGVHVPDEENEDLPDPTADSHQ